MSTSRGLERLIHYNISTHSLVPAVLATLKVKATVNNVENFKQKYVGFIREHFLETSIGVLLPSDVEFQWNVTHGSVLLVYETCYIHSAKYRS